MRRALAHAERGLGSTTPNPVVGCSIVDADGVVVGDGAHERAGEPHAEVHALEEAGSRARGATLYCTLEPCVHVGRTGPCTTRIIEAGIARVVAAMEDPDPRVAGHGIAALRAHGIDVQVGIGAAAAERLNRGYLMSTRAGRPWVILKAAMSTDGHVAAGPGARTALTGPAAHRHAQLVRARVDAVLVGSETALVDDPLLTVREVYRARPLVRAIVDRRLRTLPAARMFDAADRDPVVILTTQSSMDRQPGRRADLERAGARLVPLADPTVAASLRALSALDVQTVLLEGGPTLQGAAKAEGLVDEVHLYVAPAVVGRNGVHWLVGGPLALDDLTARAIGRDIFLEGHVHRTH